MQSWMEGYVSDVEYTAGFHGNQMPDTINLSLVMEGKAPIELEEGFTYCE